MSNHSTRDGDTWDMTSAPAIWAPTRQAEIAAAMNNIVYSREMCVSGPMGTRYSGQAVDGTAVVPFAYIGTGSPDNPNRSVVILDPTGGTGYGKTNVGDSADSLKNRLIVITIGGITVGASLGDDITATAIAVKLGAQPDMLFRTIDGVKFGCSTFGFYSGTGQVDATTGSSGFRAELQAQPWGGGAAVDIIAYVSSSSGALRLYWGTANQIAVYGYITLQAPEA